MSTSALVRGAVALKGAEVEASDLRAGAALVLAALATAEGEQTVVRGSQHVERGYEQLDRKLRGLGARFLQ